MAAVYLSVGALRSILVEVRAPDRRFRRRFRARRAVRSYSEGLGYAAGMAAELGLPLVDETGLVSEEDCARLVAEVSADG